MVRLTYTAEILGFDTIVLGVGGQKAGTTWLYDYLANHPECTMPAIKELHVFDTLFHPDVFKNDPDARLQEKILRLRDRGNDKARQLIQQLESRLRISGDFDRYLDFFHDLKIDNRLTGDITPTYAALSAEEFMRIRTLLRGAGLKVRVVFLMRDPVERYLSAVRMTAAGQNATQDPALVKRMMMRRLDKPSSAARARYDTTVRNLRAAFAEDELYIQFFESFFNEDEIRRLCSFLGISFVPAKLDKPPNPSKRDSIEFTAEDKARVYERLKPVYDGCREIFGDRIPDGWMKAP